MVGVAVVGESVGASVLSQQPRNVAPSAVGQHCAPASSPSATHRACIEQSPAIDGAAVVGEGEGASVSLQRPARTPRGSWQTPLWQSRCVPHIIPIAHFAAQSPPQSASASCSFFTPLKHDAQHGANVPSTRGQQLSPSEYMPAAPQRGCIGL